MTPFPPELRLRRPASDKRRAVAPPGDAVEISPIESSVCPLASGASVLASRIDTDVSFFVPDCEAYARVSIATP